MTVFFVMSPFKIISKFLSVNTFFLRYDNIIELVGIIQGSSYLYLKLRIYFANLIDFLFNSSNSF